MSTRKQPRAAAKSASRGRTPKAPPAVPLLPEHPPSAPVAERPRDVHRFGIPAQPLVDMLMASLPHPVCVLEADNRFCFANPAAEDFFGLSSAVLCRMRLDDLVAFGCPLLALLGQVRRTGATFNEYGVEVALPRQDGAPRLVDAYGGPVAYAPERSYLMLLGRSMAQMIERQMTHRAAARSVSGLAEMLAHEIKNPLSGIRGAAQLLEDTVPDSDRALAKLICDETDRIRDLVDRMEVFGDERPIAKEPVNIHHVLDRVRQVAETGFARGITFEESYDPSLPPVAGIRDKLIQAVLNLVKNAAEAAAEGGEPGRIVLRTRYRPGVRLSIPGAGARVSLPLVIEVEDNGPGIPEDMQASLFDPFVTSKRNGSGLGLALVAKIIGDHGGVIEFETEPRRTVFRALLPMHET